MKVLISLFIRLISSLLTRYALILLVMVGGAWLVRETTILVKTESRISALKGDSAKLRVEKSAIEAEIRNQKLAAAERIRHELATARNSLLASEEEYRKLKDAHPFMSRIPGSDVYLELMRLQAIIVAKRAKVQALEKAFWDVIDGKVDKVLLDRLKAVEASLASVEQELDIQSQVVENSKVRWLRDNVIGPEGGGVLLAAFLVLLGVIGTPYAIRSLFYFVLAPAAERRPAFKIGPNESGLVSARAAPNGSIPQSAVSVPVTLSARDVLIIKPDFIQSISTGAERSTRLVFDWKHLLTSLAANLYELEQVEGEGSTVVVSSVDDPLLEMAMIELPEGASMVFKPRCLVGAVFPANRSPRISSVWRLWSLHAWLTLQFRYLVFHGPVTLIAKGCRGIRLEPAGDGRAISQEATLGFSASLNYSNARSGPFFPYLRGKRGLFEDRFAGSAGYFAYEEIPRDERKGGVTGRGLEGITDAALKVLGV